MRALVVDDEEAMRDMLTKHLRSKCFAVDTANDGAEGSYLARTNTYDVIVLDNMLPKKSGLMVCEEIRKTGQGVPILILSVSNDSRQKVSLINAGADDYMIKPFSFEELTARIQALMRRPPQVQEEIVTLDGIVLNTRRQSVRCDDKPIYLTRKEYMLLDYLMRNQGTILSRGAIMEHVWDMSSDPFSNTIESHILSLRKKIGDSPSRRRIKTVPGRGYKIDSA